MANAYKILGQVAPANTNQADLYTVPAATQAVISVLTVCNRGATPTTFRVSVAPAGAGDATSHQICYDVPIPANDSIPVLQLASLGATDVVRITAGNTNLTFVLFGSEIT